MAGTFIQFWNAPLVYTPVVLEGLDKIAFWIVVDFLDQLISGDEALRYNEECLNLLSSAKHFQTLNFSVLSDSPTRRVRMELNMWRKSDHTYWSSKVVWSRLGSYCISIYEPNSESEYDEILHRSRMLGELIFLNLVCAKNE